MGLRGYRTVGEWYEQEQMVLEVESILPLRCSQCQSRNMIRWGRFPRDFRAPSIGDKGLIIRPFQPERDTMRYRFGDITVTFHPKDGGPNVVTVNLSTRE